VSTTRTKREDKNFHKILEEIRNRFSHTGGSPDSETILGWNKQDYKEGYVGLWSDNKDVANLISRSRQYILEVVDYGYAVDFKIEKKGFRSPIHAFKVGKEK